MKPVSGLILGNRYRLVRQIAVGGMGEVWVAKDTALSREVAVKVLREEFAGNEDFLERLRTEARNSAALSHRNIAQMFDYGEQRGSGYLVMELVHGEPMADLLEREPIIPLPRLLPILSQTALALFAAHSGGVVHRDVKPGNILLDRSGDVKITDFGVSLAANQVPMTATGMVMGTAQYLSPEQAIGQAATGASDIYALGIVAYESVVGHRPFTGATPVDIAVAHVNEPVPALPPSVDGELAELIMVMLAKDPRDRPHPADALAHALDDILRRVTEVSGRSTSRKSPQQGRHGVGTTGARASDATRRREDLAPVITPIVIPAAIRRGSRAAAPHDDAPPGRTAEGASIAEVPPTPAPPVLPWERPEPAKDGQATREGSGARPSARTGAASAADLPRSYPPRRDLRNQASTTASRSPGRERPDTRARRRQSTPTRGGGRRTPSMPMRLLGGFVILLAMILVIVFAMRGGAAERATSPQVSTTTEHLAEVRASALDLPLGIVMTSLPLDVSLTAASGMIAPDMPRAIAPAASTTPKDI